METMYNLLHNNNNNNNNNVMVNFDELIGTTEYLTVYTKCCINRCRYNRVRLPLSLSLSHTHTHIYIYIYVAKTVFNGQSLQYRHIESQKSKLQAPVLSVTGLQRKKFAILLRADFTVCTYILT